MAPTRPRWLLWTALATIAALVLYVASVGPAWWIVSRCSNQIVVEGFYTAYAPLFDVARQHEPLWNAATAYTELGAARHPYYIDIVSFGCYGGW